MLPPAWWGYRPLLSAGSPAPMGRPSGIEPDLPGPRPGVLPLPLRPPWSTRRGSNPQPSVCKTAALPVELLVEFASGTLESNQVVPAYQAGAFSVWLVPGARGRVESHHRLLGFDQALALSQLRTLDGTGRGYCPHSCWLEASCASVNTCPACARRRVSESNRVRRGLQPRALPSGPRVVAPRAGLEPARPG